MYTRNYINKAKGRNKGTQKTLRPIGNKLQNSRQKFCLMSNYIKWSKHSNQKAEVGRWIKEIYAIRRNTLYNSIKKNKMLLNKFNKNCARLVH